MRCHKTVTQVFGSVAATNFAITRFAIYAIIGQASDDFTFCDNPDFLHAASNVNL